MRRAAREAGRAHRRAAAAASRMLLELATIAHERLDDDERAIAAYERILDWEPAHEVATRELEELYSARQQWEPLAALLLDRASRQRGSRAGVAALEAVAQMYEDKVGDAARGVPRVARGVPPRARARRSCSSSSSGSAPRRDAWDELLAEGRALAEELEATHPAAAAEVWQLVGRWTRDHAANRDDAAHAFDRALRLQPDDRDTLAELLELLRGDGRWHRARRAARRARAEPSPISSAAASSTPSSASSTRRQLGEPAEAIAWYERGARRRARGARRCSSRCTGCTSQTEALGRARRAAAAADRRARPGGATARGIVDLHVELGTLLADHLGRPDDAVARVQRRARARSEARAGVRRHRSGSTRRPARPRRCSTRREAEVDAARPRRSAPRATPRSRRRGTSAARFDRAAACWQQAARARARRPRGARAGSRRALRGDEQWAELVDRAARARSSSSPSPAERSRCCSSSAASSTSQLDDVDGAIAAYQQRLAIDAATTAARSTRSRGSTIAPGSRSPRSTVLQRLLDARPPTRARAPTVPADRPRPPQRARRARTRGSHLAQALALDLDERRARTRAWRALHLLQDELVAAGEELVRAARARRRDQPTRCAASPTRRGCTAIGSRDTERARAVPAADPRARARARRCQAGARRAAARHPAVGDAVAAPRAGGRAREGRRRRCPPAERLDDLSRAPRAARSSSASSAPRSSSTTCACAIDPTPDDADRARRGAVSQQGARGRGRGVPDDRAAPRAGARARPQLIGVYRRLAEIHTALGKTLAGAAVPPEGARPRSEPSRRRSRTSPSSTWRAAASTRRSRTCARSSRARAAGRAHRRCSSGSAISIATS